MQFLFSDNTSAAYVTYMVKRYNEISTVPLGRTILQKLCYFAKHSGVPLKYDFEIYNYGPYSQELYSEVDDFKVDDLLVDTSKDNKSSKYKPGKNADALIKKYQARIDMYKERMDIIIHLFKKIDSNDFELYATLHYLYTSLKSYYSQPPELAELITKFKEIKGKKFSNSQIEGAYKELLRVGLVVGN
ncbi:MAG: hypothetical protein HZC51_05090 [Nitrospirae bacterium]|nr:hypothetical protein [Nitrospirota bacterium]